jgi:BASS family bile acid:Na+ symporter
MMNETVAAIGFPVALAIIMFGLGLGLVLEDFRRVVVYPKAAVIALSCQVFLLPTACFGLVLLFDLPPALAVGMMLVAASPGGTTANVYSHLFGGDVALNVSLTAVNSVISAVTFPVVANLAIAYFLGSGDTVVGLRFQETAQIFAIVLPPVALGMLIKARFGGIADSMNKPVKILSVVILATIIVLAIVQQRDVIIDQLRSAGAVTLAFSILSLATGYWVPRFFGVTGRQALASCMEIGVHNVAIPLAVALSPALLNSAEMAIPAAVYGALMHPAAIIAGLIARRMTDGPL